MMKNVNIQFSDFHDIVPSFDSRQYHGSINDNESRKIMMMTCHY
jgi:uncharacterized membrane protein